MIHLKIKTVVVEMTSKVNKVPPDGGYGWVVTFAYALNNVSTYLKYPYSIPILAMQSYSSLHIFDR